MGDRPAGPVPAGGSALFLQTVGGELEQAEQRTLEAHEAQSATALAAGAVLVRAVMGWVRLRQAQARQMTTKLDGAWQAAVGLAVREDREERVARVDREEQTAQKVCER